MTQTDVRFGSLYRTVPLSLTFSFFCLSSISLHDHDADVSTTLLSAEDQYLKLQACTDKCDSFSLVRQSATVVLYDTNGES